MSHYLIGLTKVSGHDGMQDYISRVKPTVAQYGGEFVFEGAFEEAIEGEFEATSGAVIRFNDADAAKRWYHSPEYTELRDLRASFGESTLLLMREFGS